MTFREASLRIDNGLNKLATNDQENVPYFQKEIALNKALSQWIRRNRHGNNAYKEGHESSLERMEDLKFLLKTQEIASYKRDLYNEVKDLPEDYNTLSRLSVYASKGDCTSVLMDSQLREVASVDRLLLDWAEQPSFDFEQTFHTLQGNTLRVYHNKDFTVSRVVLTYYKDPNRISRSKPEEIWEMKEDLAELIVDEAIKLLASDIGDPNAFTVKAQTVEQNN